MTIRNWQLGYRVKPAGVPIRSRSAFCAAAVALWGAGGGVLAQTAPGDWTGQPLPTILAVPGGITYNNVNDAAMVSQAGPACVNTNLSIISANSPCSDSETAAGAATITYSNFSTLRKISSLPAGVTAPGSLAFVNLQGAYIDGGSPTGVSNINASIPLSAFATSSSVTSEISRATTAESTLSANATTETSRAEGAETTLSSGLAQETQRAQSAETTIATGVTQETTRAKGAETTLASGLTQETARAQGAEATIATGLTQETTRATGAETTLASGLTQETARAQGAEANLGSEISAETNARLADIARVSRGYRAATATAIALGGLGVLPGKRLNLTLNTGTFEGQWAVAAQGAYLINEHAMLNAGVSSSTSGAGTGARAGITLGW